MIRIRVWNLDSNQDANAVKYLKDGLQESTQRGQVAIQTAGRNAFHKCHKMGIPEPESLKKAIQHFLKQDDCIVFVTDTTKPKSSNQKLIDEIKNIVSQNNFADKIYFSKEITNDSTSNDKEWENIISNIRSKVESNQNQLKKEWDNITARFNKAFADTPEEEIIRDFEEAIKEVRSERT